MKEALGGGRKIPSVGTRSIILESRLYHEKPLVV